MATMTGVLRGTGRERAEWFQILDEWGAKGRPYREIASWLTDEHGLSRWWAQKLIVEYEQDRGVRPPGVRPDGTFTVTASKTIAAAASAAEDAFVKPALRRRWLGDGSLRKRGDGLRFDWDGGPSRVNVSIEDKTRERCVVAIEHQKIEDAARARELKAAWRERLSSLKAVLEEKH